MKKHLRLLLVPALVVLAACSPAADTGMDDDDSASSAAMMPASEAMMDSSEAAMQGEPRVITVNVSNWEFAPAVVQVKKGEKVTLRFVDETGNHGVAVPGLKINAYLPQGKTVDVALDTSTEGAFDGFCNVPCGPGHRDMTFQIVVS